MARSRPMNYVPQHWTCSSCLSTAVMKIYSPEEETMEAALKAQGWTDRKGHLYCAACSEFFPDD